MQNVSEEINLTAHSMACMYKWLDRVQHAPHHQSSEKEKDFSISVW